MKEREGPEMGANKGAGGNQKGIENLDQGGPNNKGKALLWMATGKGGFINMNRHDDGRIVELGPSGEPIDQ